MKRYLAFLMGLLLVLGAWSTAFAATVKAPALKCDGKSVDSREIVKYDLADGTLTIKWTPQSAADHYYYKCIGLNEKPDFGDSYQGNRGTILAEGTVTSNTTSKCKFTVSTSKMEDYDYLKIAVAAYDSAGTAYWTNFGVELTDSDKIVAEPALKCDGSAVDSREIVKYDLADGTLTIRWTPQSAADHYYYKCIGLNEKPDFWDSYQGNRGTILAEGTVTSNTTSKCKFTVSTSKMEDYDYLKIAVAAYDSAGTAYWTNFGVELTTACAHASVTWKIKNNATCIAAGVEESICNSCGAIVGSRNVPAKGHTAGEWQVITAATETSSGLRRQSCTVCGKVVKEEVIPAIPVQSDDPYPAKGSTLLEVARSQIGYKGSNTSSNTTGANVTATGNYTKYGVYTGTSGQSWCASFISWCGKQAGVSNIKKTAGASPKLLCSNITTKNAIAYFELTALQKQNHSYMATYGVKVERGFKPAPGDLIFFLWNSDKTSYSFSHVGIVSRVDSSKVYYIDGNGSGDVVTERSRSLTDTQIVAYCKVSGAYNVTPKPPVKASDPVFNGHTALSVTEYDLANGSLTISWSAKNAAKYYVTAILLNEKPTSDVDNQADRAVKTIKKGEQTANSLTMTVDDLTGGQYLKFAVGAASNEESDYHWSWIGFHLTDSRVPVCTHTSTTWRIKTNATCTTSGIEEALCNSCGEVINTRTIPAKGHTPGEWTVVTEATETTTGLKRQSCTVCGATLKENVIPATAASSVSYSKVRLKPGDTFVMSVILSEVDGSEAARVSIDVGSAPVTFIKAEAISENGNAVNEPPDLSGRFSIMNANGVVAGKVGTVTLQLNENAEIGSTYYITLNGSLAATGVSGSLQIEVGSSRVPGDANEDGIVDIFDALLVLKFDSGWNVALNKSNADVNADGSADIFDALLLLKYDSGWNVELK